MNSAVGWYLVQKLQVLPTPQKLVEVEDSPSCETVKLLPQQAEEERTEISRARQKKISNLFQTRDLGGNCLVAAKRKQCSHILTY
jgi:hypothetical protein